ncbi:hypothetical protein GCM10011351_23830 [Paraliobacillus quinghaiensis]|uniref:DUF2524 family protein n=1 Tax=Paraliobacillus quinghaiensis TaxID=470815 RepID=A0A917TTQ0_9BACI|nr:DUF2524 family protein [Paraliobacillus quinghaiensis]GGM36898.1 hypothetical protein GCM10011351_23830 [Paraliobacillus quinghaiensis]
MATRQSMEELIAKAEQKLDVAKKQLDRVNRNGYEVDEAYTEAQIELSNMDSEIDKMMLSANHQQREQLHRLHLQVTDYWNDMILDANDLHH